MYLDTYSARMAMDGETAGERKRNRAREKVILEFENDPSAMKVEAIQPDGDAVEKRIRVVNESLLKQLNPERVYSKFVIPHPEEEMISGTMLFDLYNQDWIVTAVTGLGGVTQQAMIQRMNQIIYMKLDGQQLSLPAVVNGVSRLSDGIFQLEMLTYADELLKVKVQLNETTKKIRRNTRFMISNKAYRLTKIDDYTDENILNWIVREDGLDADDDLDEKLVNFKEDAAVEIIEGAAKITLGKDFYYRFQEEGSPVWSIESADSRYIQLTTLENNHAVLRVKEYKKNYYFNLSAKVGEETYTKTIQVISLL